jgi:tRNA A58 N-methylase Trm61
VYSYELRNEFQEVARRNLERYGLLEWVELKTRDIARGFDEQDADALFLDVREPWRFLEHVQGALKGGGFFGSLVPTANQLVNLTRDLHRTGFLGVEVKELLLRPYRATADRLRPEDRMVAHTGYLVLARAPYQLPRRRPSANELAQLSRQQLLDRLTKLVRGWMVARAQQRRLRKRHPVSYHYSA